MDKLEKLESQKRAIDSRIRKERKALKEKNERSIGKNVMKHFGVSTWNEFETKLSNESLVLTNEQVSFDISQHDFEILKELKIHAEEMEWNGKFWKANNLPKLTESLSKLRDDKQINN